jgi:hypothetical protein
VQLKLKEITQKLEQQVQESQTQATEAAALATNTRRKSITEREGHEELMRVAEADAEQKAERLQSEIEELRASNLRLESAQSRNRAGQCWAPFL